MRKAAIFLVALGLPAFATAQGMMSGWKAMHSAEHADSYLSAEIESVEAELGDKPVGELTLNELKPFEERLAAAAGKDAYVARSAMRSMMLPGLGQFQNGDSGAGAGFLALHLATAAGALVGSYYLLPSSLRFDRLDYLNTPLTDIKAAWLGQSLADYLPALGVSAGGMLLDGLVRMWSARSAATEARASVEAGKARVSPGFGPGYLGMRMRF